MSSGDEASISGQWITRDRQLVQQVAEEILREEAWWIAARSGKYLVRGTVWVDGRCSEHVALEALPPGLQFTLGRG